MADRKDSRPSTQPPYRVSRAPDPAPPVPWSPFAKPADPKEPADAGAQRIDAIPYRSEYAVMMDMLAGRKSPEAEELDKIIAEQNAAINAAFRRLREGEGTPLNIAKELRPFAEQLETLPLPDTEHARTVLGLVQLSNSDAFALVENERVAPDRAACVGHYARNVFAYHHPPRVGADFQIRAMTRLADVEPASAERMVNLIEEVANEVVNQQQRRINSERIWNKPSWSIWNALSWIAFRDLTLLCEIEDEGSLRRATWYGHPSLQEAAPESLLLSALQRGQVHAIRDGAKLPAIYWFDKQKVERDTWFERNRMVRLWRDGRWLLGQMMLWIMTRDPHRVEEAGASGLDRSAAALVIEQRPHERRDTAANDLRQLCRKGAIQAFDGVSPIKPEAWEDLQIMWRESAPYLWSHARWGEAYPNIGFSRVDALREFKPVAPGPAGPPHAEAEEAVRLDSEPPAPTNDQSQRKKSAEEKEADALDIAKTFLVDGIAPNYKDHATAVMGVLKVKYPLNHIRREDLEILLQATFKRREPGEKIKKRR